MELREKAVLPHWAGGLDLAYAPPPPANHQTLPLGSGITVAKKLWWVKDNPGDTPGASEAGEKGPVLLVNRSVRALYILRIGNRLPCRKGQVFVFPLCGMRSQVADALEKGILFPQLKQNDFIADPPIM